MKQAEREAKLLERITQREKKLWAEDKKLIGMDEVGRGSLAGPVLVCGLMLPPEPLVLGVNDSKKLTEKKRERLYGELMEHVICVGIGMRDEKRVDKINILEATREAFSEAYQDLAVQPDYVLTDSIQGVHFPVPFESIVQGDSQSYMIAAASIVAKVTRDHMMIEYAQQYPEYGFERNKGYGTAEHIEAIRKYGPCEIHRRTFIKKFVS